MFAVRVLPHFLNQAPPVAQQLSRLDLPKVPHFGHANAVKMPGARIVNVPVSIVILVLADAVADMEADCVIAWALDRIAVGVVDTTTFLRTYSLPLSL